MLCSRKASRTYDTTVWTQSTQKHCNISSILPPTLHVLSHQDYTTHIVSQAVIGHPLFTIIYHTPHHYWHSSHIALTYSGLYAHKSTAYILLFYIFFLHIWVTTLRHQYIITINHLHRHNTICSNFITPNKNTSFPLFTTPRATSVLQGPP